MSCLAKVCLHTAWVLLQEWFAETRMAEYINILRKKMHVAGVCVFTNLSLCEEWCVKLHQVLHLIFTDTDQGLEKGAGRID